MSSAELHSDSSPTPQALAESLLQRVLAADGETTLDDLVAADRARPDRDASTPLKKFLDARTVEETLECWFGKSWSGDTRLRDPKTLSARLADTKQEIDALLADLSALTRADSRAVGAAQVRDVLLRLQAWERSIRADANTPTPTFIASGQLTPESEEIASRYSKSLRKSAAPQP